MNDLDKLRNFIIEEIKYTAKYIAKLEIECESNKNKIDELEKRIKWLTKGQTLRRWIWIKKNLEYGYKNVGVEIIMRSINNTSNPGLVI